MSHAIAILRCIHERDVFERAYQQRLARRLLVTHSYDEDLEHAVVGHLKLECGYEFISRLGRMFADMASSKQCASFFQAHLRRCVSSCAARD